jgi:hypothetical protein
VGIHQHLGVSCFESLEMEAGPRKL